MSIRSLLFVAAIGLAAHCGGLQAASPAVTGADVNAPAEARDSSALDEVLVTAQRREERSQDVPITITSLSAEALQRASVQSVSDLQTVTPGFRLDNYGGLYQPTIRGISTSIGCPSCGTDVGIYIDGFYMAHGMGLELPIFNISNVQVLKGPQGTLFGRNTVGGAVMINTADPSRVTRAYVEGSYGNYQAQQYQAYLTTGLTDRVAVDIGGAFSIGNGWVTNLRDGNDKYGQYENSVARLGFKADITDTFSLLFRYEHESLDDPTGLLYSPYLSNGKPLTFGAYLPGALVASQRGDIASNQQLAQRSLLDSYRLTGTLDLGFGVLKSYSQYRADRTPTLRSTYSFDSQDSLLLNVPDKTRTITQEFLLTSKGSSRIEWTAGAYYYNSKDAYYNTTVSLSGSPFAFQSANGSDDKSYSVYGNITVEPLDRLFFTAGLRYNHDQQVNAFTRLPTGQTDLPVLTSNPVTPRAVLRYQIDDKSSTYFSFARGYKSAIYDTGGPVSPPVRPEQISAFEIGYKFAAKRLSLDLSSFYYDYTNQQLASQIFLNGAEDIQITNAASSHMYGADADLKFEVFRGLEFNTGLEWLDAKYDSFPNAPAFSVDAAHLLEAVSVDAAGNEMARAPKFTANVGANYSTQIARGTFDLSGNLYYSSRFFFDQAQQIPQDGYATLGMRASWTNPSGRYVIALAGKNITNKRYYASALQTIFGVGGIWGAPATVEGSIRVNFD